MHRSIIKYFPRFSFHPISRQQIRGVIGRVTKGLSNKRFAEDDQDVINSRQRNDIEEDRI